MTQRYRMLVVLVALMSFTAGFVRGSSSGINSLIAVTQLKAENANANALKGAEQQRQLVNKQQTLHAQQEHRLLQQQFEDDARRFAEISNDLKRLSAEVAKLNCR